MNEDNRAVELLRRHKLTLAEKLATEPSLLAHVRGSPL